MGVGGRGVKVGVEVAVRVIVGVNVTVGGTKTVDVLMGRGVEVCTVVALEKGVDAARSEDGKIVCQVQIPLPNRPRPHRQKPIIMTNARGGRFPFRMA